MTAKRAVLVLLLAVFAVGVVGAIRACGEYQRYVPFQDCERAALPEPPVVSPEEQSAEEAGESGESPRPTPRRHRSRSKQPLGTLEVVVTDPDGAPVVGAQVKAWKEAVTGPDGVARIEKVPHTFVSVIVKPPAEGTQSNLIGENTIAGGPGRLEVRLGWSRRLRVQVVTSEGNPPSEAVVVNWSRTGWRRDPLGRRPGEWGQREVDASGFVEVPLGEGTYRVSASPKSWRNSSFTTGVPREVAPGIAAITLALRTGAPITAAVQCADGNRPISGLVHYRVVHAGRPFREPVAHGDVEKGEIRSRPLPFGEVYDVYLNGSPEPRGPRWWGCARGLRPGVRGKPIRLGTGGTVTGRVTDERGDPPPRRIHVVASVDEVGDSMGVICTTGTDESGRYELEGLPSMPLEVRAAGYEWFTPNPVRGVRPGEVDVRIVLRPLHELRGHVSFEEGVEHIGGIVGARIDGGRGSSDNVSPLGTFHIRHLRPGRHRLTWRVFPGRAIDLGFVDVPADRELDLTVRLPR